MPAFSDAFGNIKAELSKKLNNTLRSLASSYIKEGHSPKGEIWVKEYQNGELVSDKCLKENIIVDGAGVLLARLLKNNTEPVNGIYCLAVGTGDNLWNPMNPPAPVGTETTLFAELARVAIQSSRFITPILGTVSPTPTNIIDLDFEFPEGVATGPLVELGLFGGDATLAVNSGTQVTYKTYAVINKPASSSFVFTYRLTL